MMDKVDISGFVAVVTGASSGIGLEFCRELARRGCNLVMISNQDAELRRHAREIAESTGTKVYPLPLDLTAPNVAKSIDAWLDSNALDPEILINNAGIFSFNTVEATSPEKVDCYIDLHIRAVTTISRRFANRFRKRGRGWMLNMSSMSCWMPMPGIALYSATKAYIRVFTRALHYELRDSGVRVCVASPGGIATSLFGLPDNLMRLAVRLHAVQTPEKFVRKGIDAMLRGRKQYINGWLNRIAIVAVGMTPTWIRMLVKRKMLDKNIIRQ